jgi:hypothetical protein
MGKQITWLRGIAASMLIVGLIGCDDNQPTAPNSGWNIPIGTPPNFVVKADGTVMETVTDLIWLQDSTCFDQLSWTDAVQAVSQLRSGMCGLTDGSRAGDWRLPDVAEIQFLMDYTRARPPLPVGHPFLNVESNWYWLSRSYASDQNFAWSAFFYDGSICGSFKANLTYSWPVRGKRIFDVPPDFVDNHDGTVTDRVTGLIWLKDADCFASQPWSDAITTAGNLKDGLCGLTDGSKAGDWRLPDVKELRSLADYTRFDPALPVGHPFLNVQSNVFSDEYWASTVYVPVPHGAWLVSFHSGGVSASDMGAPAHVWPVR